MVEGIFLLRTVEEFLVKRTGRRVSTFTMKLNEIEDGLRLFQPTLFARTLVEIVQVGGENDSNQSEE